MDRNINLASKRIIEESIVSIIKIGVICSSESLIDRMDISVVLSTLQEIKKKILQR